MANIHTHIVKVQTPLAGTDRHSHEQVCLVYDRMRKHVIEQPIQQRTRDALKGDARAFFEAAWSGSAWSIGKRAPEQFW